MLVFMMMMAVVMEMVLHIMLFKSCKMIIIIMTMILMVMLILQKGSVYFNEGREKKEPQAITKQANFT